MGTIIKEIKIPDDNYSFISDDWEEGDVLKNLSKINIFVGENNSGKSRFLRSLVSNELEFKPNNNEIEEINVALSNLRGKKLDYKYCFEAGLHFDSYFQNIEFLRTNSYLDAHEAIESLENTMKKYKAFIDKYEEKSNEDRIDEYQTDKYVYKYSESFLKDIKDLLSENQMFKPFRNIYIPILRGLRPVKNGNAQIETKEGTFYYDVYGMRTFDDYFNDLGGSFKEFKEFKIFTGLNIYDTFKRYSHGNLNEREVLIEFQKYLSNFFDGKEVLLVPKLNDDVLTIKIGNEKEKPIYHLGDGIQSIIIMTFPLFLYKNKLKENEKALIFIEEPEYLLHPGLQRKLIETFCDKCFKNFQFFFTTHSNHFLDITLDFDNISIFTLRKKLDGTTKEINPKFSIKNLLEGDTSVLELLGVRNSSVFLSNCTLWVEGITDRHYLRHYLKLYAKEHENDPDFEDFKEDYHYSYVEYGGNNITHWSFLDKEEKPINVEKLCGRLLLLADKDQGKNERHKQLKETLKERYYPLKCREIENLVSPEVLLKIVKEYEWISENQHSNNINEDFKYADYKNRLLGKFIEEKIIIDKEKMKIKSYMANSGTIKDKRGFLDKAKKYIQKWDDLSPEAQEITVKVYNFIKEHNS